MLSERWRQPLQIHWGLYKLKRFPYPVLPATQVSILTLTAANWHLACCMCASGFPWGVCHANRNLCLNVPVCVHGFCGAGLATKLLLSPFPSFAELVGPSEGGPKVRALPRNSRLVCLHLLQAIGCHQWGVPESRIDFDSLQSYAGQAQSRRQSRQLRLLPKFPGCLSHLCKRLGERDAARPPC